MQSDKKKHFLVCMAASFIAGLPMFIAGMPFLALITGASFSAGLAIGKEYGDSKVKGNRWDWMDILADVGGLIVGAIPYMICTILLGGGREVVWL